MKSLLLRYRRIPTGDAGYALAMSALMLLPLLAFSGLAVDVGSWYARGAELQRTADAAALAGAGSLPRGVAQAQAVAVSVAAQNGFTNGVDGIEVQAVYVDPDRMKVTITDNQVPQYLTGFIRSSVSVQRHSTAEYVPPVKMGSPRNFLGTGTQEFAPYGPENFWLAISNPCASKENGDRIQAISNANFNNTNNPRHGYGANSSYSYDRCTGGDTIPNSEYSEHGYFYAVHFERSYTGSVDIQVYDADFCPNDGTDVPDGAKSYMYDSRGRLVENTLVGFTTTFRMRANDSGNPILATPIGNTWRLNGNNCSYYHKQWRTLHTLTNPTRGTYYIQVTSSDPKSTSYQGASNSFSIRAQIGATFQPCTTESSGAIGYNANCPNVFAIENLGVSVNIPDGQPSWYLADIGVEHSGKTMVVNLWDPGEGSEALELLDPNGNPVNFKWSVVKNQGDTAPTGGFGPGVTNKLDLIGTVAVYCRANQNNSTWYYQGDGAGTACPSNRPIRRTSERNPQPGPRRASLSKYSDRSLILEVDLPEDINAAYGGKTWWRIRYTFGSVPTDRTTWSVTIKGDPVRIVE